MMDNLSLLREEIEKRSLVLAASMGVDLVDLKVRKQGKTLVIEVFIDLPDGGIGIEQCAAFNRALDQELYEEMNLGNDYTLEVSSPGLDRPLSTGADFRRSVGQNVHLFLREPVAGKREMDGVIVAVGGECVILETKFGEISVELGKVEKGKIII